MNLYGRLVQVLLQPQNRLGKTDPFSVEALPSVLYRHKRYMHFYASGSLTMFQHLFPIRHGLSMAVGISEMVTLTH